MAKKSKLRLSDISYKDVCTHDTLEFGGGGKENVYWVQCAKCKANRIQYQSNRDCFKLDGEILFRE